MLPLGLYAKHEAELLRERPGCAEDVAKTKSFDLLARDPDAKLIISCKFHIMLISLSSRHIVLKSLADLRSSWGNRLDATSNFT